MFFRPLPRPFALACRAVLLGTHVVALREHAKRGGFPAQRVSAIATIIDPT